MRPLRIAIIGYGKIAADQHVPSIAANPRFELAGTSSREGKGPQPNEQGEYDDAAGRDPARLRLANQGSR